MCRNASGTVRSDAQQTMVAQDHGCGFAVPRSFTRASLLALLQKELGAFVFVVGDVVVETGGVHADVQETAFQRRHGHSGPGMGVDHAVGIVKQRCWGCAWIALWMTNPAGLKG